MKRDNVKHRIFKKYFGHFIQNLGITKFARQSPTPSVFSGAVDAVCAEEAGRGGGRVLGRDLRLHSDHRGRLRGQDVSSGGPSLFIKFSYACEQCSGSEIIHYRTDPDPRNENQEFRLRILDPDPPNN